jgi:hypothetical protein
MLALRKLFRGQGRVISEGQDWHPYEVIELGAHSLIPGHEREFVACTLLVIAAIADGVDTSTTLAWKLDDRAADYDALPHGLREIVLDAYIQANQARPQDI